MEDAFRLLLNGEYLRAILEPFIRISGETFFYFMILLATMSLLYLTMQDIALPIIFLLIAFGSLTLSHLSPFNTASYNMIPAEFDNVMHIAIALGLTFLVYKVWRR